MAATTLLLRTHHHPYKPQPPPPRAPVLCRATTAAGAAAALRSLAPPTRPELLSLDLPRYDPARSRPVDLAVVGGGPAGLAVAQRVAEAGLTVCAIDPSPALVWPNNYGVPIQLAA